MAPDRSTRGADAVARALAAAGVRTVFTLSGNQIMPVFDACLDAGIRLIHVRHEGAAVYMAEAWAQLTGEVGVALVTAGPGFSNGLSALYSARASESPVLLLSGDSVVAQDGAGAFQEMAQVAMSGPLTKAAWRAMAPGEVGRDLAKAIGIANGGRPGPVHVALPFDVLTARLTEAAVPPSADFEAAPLPLEDGLAQEILDAAGAARRPLVLAGPALCRGGPAGMLARLGDATGVPVVPMESPRGLKDLSLGAVAEIVAQADLILCLGKAVDFCIGFGRPPAVSDRCRFVQVDPDPAMVERGRRLLGERLVVAACADARAAAVRLAEAAHGRGRRDGGWADDVRSAMRHRPAEWQSLRSADEGPIHPVELCRAVASLLDASSDPVLIIDGGEFGQWAQACLTVRRRIINGPSGAIGAAPAYAVAASLAAPGVPVFALMGDGTAGFYLCEFDTAVRYNAALVAIIGNDARWNAEYQIQLRDYGPDRLVGCELMPTRYDLAVTALGGHGEYVRCPADLLPALRRAQGSRVPACVNVGIESCAAPTFRLAPPV